MFQERFTEEFARERWVDDGASLQELAREMGVTQEAIRARLGHFKIFSIRLNHFYLKRDITERKKRYEQLAHELHLTRANMIAKIRLVGLDPFVNSARKLLNKEYMEQHFKENHTNSIINISDFIRYCEEGLIMPAIENPLIFEKVPSLLVLLD